MCEHEHVEVIDSYLHQVSIFGAEILFEVLRCLDCGQKLVQPYLALSRMSVTDNMLIFQDEEIYPSLEYVEYVLKIKRKDIPEELLQIIFVDSKGEEIEK